MQSFDMSLTSSLLSHPIPAATQELIARSLWNSTDYKILNLSLYPYFQYYTEQCRIAFQVYESHMQAKTHQDVLKIVQYFQEGIARETIQQLLFAESHVDKSSEGHKAIFDSSIDLAARLAFMLDIGELRNAFSGRRRLIWIKGTVQGFVEDIFADQAVLEHEGIKLGTAFTARNLNLVAGLRIELTTNLADHLRLRNEDRTVSIFHHASFLRCQLKSLIFPPGLIQETLQTLALLFPQGERSTEKWYSKQDSPEDLDPGVLHCGKFGDNLRQIEKYTFWHDRLVILKQAFDESQPKTVTQLWNDRREGSQWYALWVAIGITLFFGLVQSIEGAVQVYKAYHPE